MIPRRDWFGGAATRITGSARPVPARPCVSAGPGPSRPGQCTVHLPARAEPARPSPPEAIYSGRLLVAAAAAKLVVVVAAAGGRGGGAPAGGRGGGGMKAAAVAAAEWPRRLGYFVMRYRLPVCAPACLPACARAMNGRARWPSLPFEPARPITGPARLARCAGPGRPGRGPDPWFSIAKHCY